MKMLKQEKELREAIDATMGSHDPLVCRRMRAFERAVRADEREKCINSATTYLHRTYYQHASEDWLLEEIAAAIREGKK